MSDKLLRCKFKIIKKYDMNGSYIWSAYAEHEQIYYGLECRSIRINKYLYRHVNKMAKVLCKETDIVTTFNYENPFNYDSPILEVVDIIEE